MKIRPRQQLLDVWRSILDHSYKDGRWVWADGSGADSVRDAQQLLCLMSPTVEIESLRFSYPDNTYEDVLSALSGFGGAVAIPRTVLRILVEYLEKHQVDGAPVFSGAGYISTVDPAVDLPDELRSVDVVEGFALSVTLSLAILGFAREYRQVVASSELVATTQHLERLAGERLTAALVGLVRSFAVDTFEYDSEDGQALVETLNQSNHSTRRVAGEVRRALRDITASLGDLRLGTGDPGDLDNPNRLYQVGWSWGVVAEAPTVPFVTDQASQRPGNAYPAPYLYFTVVALDGLADLFSPRTRRLGLLNEEQQRLSQALQIRWELTQRYWSTLASFGDGRWPLEDLPWRTLDRVEHDYYSLLVTAITMRDLSERQSTNREAMRLGEVIRELGNRSRITRRPLRDDPALDVHAHGVSVAMEQVARTGTKTVSMQWLAVDFSALLLKRVVRLIQLLTDPESRAMMSDYLDQVWQHTLQRRLGNNPRGTLWDQPAHVYPELGRRSGEPLWQPTLRVVESLVQAADTTSRPPLDNEPMVARARDLVFEAEHLYDQEVQRGGVSVAPAIQELLNSVSARIQRARQILDDRPASAFSVMIQALQDLDSLSAARQGREE